MNEHIKELAIQAAATKKYHPPVWQFYDHELETFVHSIVQACINHIETYQIPVGNSSAGELACQWTWDALYQIRDNIKEHFYAKPDSSRTNDSE